MEQNYRNRHLSVGSGQEHITELEAFLERIADDFHIYDDYYGNIIASVTTAYELIAEHRTEKSYIDIYFKAQKAGIDFLIKMEDEFLDIARNLDVLRDEKEAEKELNESQRKLLMINMLADSVVVDNKRCTLELIFHVTGVNDYLAIQRQELLYNYYDKLVREKKTQR